VTLESAGQSPSGSLFMKKSYQPVEEVTKELDEE
jgi:hypothetical protein